MKTRLLLVHLTLTVFILSMVSSCKDRQEIVISDVHKKHIPENVQLLEYNSKSIVIAWDFIKNASSYTVQLLTAPDSDHPLFTYTTTNNDYFEFGNLNSRQSYYARVRANFPYSATSEWIYVRKDADIARIIPNYGIVNSDFEIINIKSINTSSSTITAEWSFTDFIDMDNEIANSFDLALYKDKACTDLEISWTDLNGIFAASTANLPKPLRFTFSGLKSTTDYYLKIKDKKSGIETNPVHFKTLETQPLASNTPSKAGDILISQDFSNFIHGGDILFSAGGYTVGTAPGRASWQKASGSNPVDASLGQNFCDATVEFNVFDGGNVTKEYTIGVGMDNWGKSGNTSTKPGYIKIGGSSAVGILYTAPLNYSGASNSIEVSFKAAAYSEGNSNFCENIMLEVIEGASFSAKGAISNLSGVSKKDSKKVSIINSIKKFDDYTVVLNNVSPNSRIAFSSDPSATANNKTRFLLDNIVIKLK